MAQINRKPTPPGPITELFDRLDDLHLAAGRPSMREIAMRAGRGSISASTVHNVFRASRVPRWNFLEQIVKALGGDTDEFMSLWQAAWREQAINPSGEALLGQASTSNTSTSSEAAADRLPLATEQRKLPNWVDPGFAGEVTYGQDLLGVKRDATALAVLLASSALTPPVALGLYGEWGSGKTFFMRTLEHDINTLTAEGSPDFCRRVASVWFNAWHYAEGNLWASLIHNIFLSLNGETPAPEQALDEMLATIDGIQEAKTEAARQADVAQAAADRLREEVSNREKIHNQSKADIAKIRARDVWVSVKVDANLRRAFEDAAAQLGISEIGTDTREVARAVGEVHSLVQRGRSLATTGPWWKSPLALGLAAAVTASVAGLILAAAVNWRQAWLAPMVAVVGQLAAVASGMASWLSRQTVIARKLLEPGERIRRQIDQRLAAEETKYRAETAIAQQDLAETEAWLLAARQQLATAEMREAEARAELLQLTGPRLLRKYLAERASSSDYGQYLGAVALAHRDLRDLDAYIRAAAANRDEDDETIDRIILYIDDLDRCRPETVVQVLEAVNLLLALPLFVVVVGVDARWLIRSLKDRHPVLLEPALTTTRNISTAPSDYLDKIFQLTYCLPPMTPQACAALLQYTAGNSHIAASPEILGLGMMSADYIDNSKVDGVEFGGHNYNDESSDPGMAQNESDLPGSPIEQSRLHAEAIEISNEEAGYLEIIAPLVSSSPRRAKRFLNIYRVVKARVMADPDMHEELSASSVHSYGTVSLLVLIALAVGLPDVAAQALESYDMTDGMTLREWLNQNISALTQGTIEHSQVDNFLARAGAVSETPMSEIMRWVPIARRFAWPAIEHTVRIKDR